MISISFDAECVEMPVSDEQKLRNWIEKVAHTHNRTVGRIAYIFTNDVTILDINRKFLNHDYYTDIITFDYSRRKLISGDLYISIDTVRTNADMMNVSFEKELMRVIIHGVLHLCGIDDKGEGQREIMEKHENEALTLLFG